MTDDHADDIKVPREMANAVNLMAHPLAGVAALSAIGFGVAGQALGMWMGALAGAAAASERLLQTALDAGEGAAAPSQTAAKVRARARRVMEQAQSFALEVGEARTVTAAAGDPAPAEPDLRQPRATERPQAPDDLKAIPGVGPKLEQVLNGLGVWTHAQIAAWTPAEIAWVDDYLGFKGRIERDGWVGRAAALASDGTGQ